MNQGEEPGSVHGEILETQGLKTWAAELAEHGVEDFYGNGALRIRTHYR